MHQPTNKQSEHESIMLSIMMLCFAFFPVKTYTCYFSNACLMHAISMYFRITRPSSIMHTVHDKAVHINAVLCQPTQACTGHRTELLTGLAGDE